MSALPRLRILADDLTGALDCAAAFGAGVPVHLGAPASQQAPGIDTVATATRDVAPTKLPALLEPSLAWLRGADLAFKKVDSLLRGNTLDEADWLARHGGFAGLAMVPAFPAQQRVTERGQQWWRQADGARTPVAASMQDGLHARGWRVVTTAQPPTLQDGLVAWVPDVLSDADLDAVAEHALSHPGWLWCGSAGLAHALARRQPSRPASAALAPSHGPTLLVSASHHPVSREQWRVLRAAHAGACHAGEDPATLAQAAEHYPSLIDLSASQALRPEQAATLLAAQTQAIATHAPRPRVLVVVGGDTLLALCRALGAQSLQSEQALPRAGWGCARMRGGRWDGLLCHTRSGAFGGPQDLLEVLACV